MSLRQPSGRRGLEPVDHSGTAPWDLAALCAPRLRVLPSIAASALLLSILLCGCSPIYVMKSWNGQRRLMSKRRPVAEVLADPAAPASLKTKLRLTGEIRSFAASMGLPASKSYTSYVDVGRPYVTYAVSASPKLSLDPHEWWFPVIGKVPYKGFFSLPDAEKEQAKLERKGLDTFLRGVPAYSTLGWYADPVLSTMLEASAGELAETLIHELAHQAVYFKSDSDFNESSATFIGEQGTEDFLAAKFGPQSLELQAYRIEREDEALRDARWEEVAKRLQAIYSSKASDSEKLAKREEIFAAAKSILAVKELNNAVILAHRLYRADLSDFRAAYERQGRDWPKTIALLGSLNKKDPKIALKEWLAKAP